MLKSVLPSPDGVTRTCARCGLVYVPPAPKDQGHDRTSIAPARQGRGRPREAAYAYRCDAMVRTKSTLGRGSGALLLLAQFALGEARQHMKAQAHVERLAVARKAMRRMQRIASDLQELAQASLQAGYAPLGLLGQEPDAYWSAIESIADHVVALTPRFDDVSRRAEAETAGFYATRPSIQTASLERAIVNELRATAPALVDRGPTLLGYWGIAAGVHPPVKEYDDFKKYVDAWKSAMRPQILARPVRRGRGAR